MIGDQLADFQKPIVACLNRHLHKAGFGLLYISGGALKPTADWDENTPLARNAIYPLTRNFPVEGFIILTASIGNHANARQLAHFVKQFTHRPVVCYGSSVPRVASVQIDNYSMMSRLMEHMTADPARQRFVFIRGFPDSPRSLAQERAFRDALTHRQIPVDEALFINGNFRAADAYYALDTLLQHTRDIDAVVAANDEMAQTAIHALASHGLRVPEDVIVSGFYNSLTASTSLPPISTVHCTDDSMAALATASLQSQIISGDYVSSNSKVLHPPARLILRASTEAPLDKPLTDDVEHVFDAAECRQTLLHCMSNLRTPPALLVEDVVDDVVSMLVNGTPYSNTRLEAALHNLHYRPGDVFWWRHLHRQITAHLESCGSEGQSSDALSRAAIILGKIHETVWSVENALSIINDRYTETAQRFRTNLMQVSGIDDLIAAMNEISVHCGSKTTFICVYEHTSGQPDDFAKVIFQRPDNILGEAGNDRFPSAEILPGHFLNSDFPGPLVLEPLCVGSTHLGYLILDMSSEEYRNQSNIAALSDFIANALWRVLTSH